MDRGTRKRLFGLFLLSLALRLALVFAAGPLTEPDSLTYENLALNMAAGRGYVDTREFRILDSSMAVTPVYPAFLAAVYSVFGFGREAAVVIQQVLGALLVLLVHAIGSLLFGARTGSWTALAVAVHPWLIFSGNSLMTEALFTFLLAASLYFLVIGLSAGRTRHVASAGFLLGLAILCRGAFQLYVVFVPVIFWLALRDARRAARYSLVFLIPALVLLTAWAWRNQRVHGFFGLTATGGINFLAGLNLPASEYEGQNPVEDALREACADPSPPTIMSVLPAADAQRMIFKRGNVFCTNLAVQSLLARGWAMPEINGQFMGVAARHIRKAPLDYLGRCIRQGAALWSGYQAEWLGGAFAGTFAENIRAREYGVAAVKVAFRILFGAILLILAVRGVWVVARGGPALGWLPVSTFLYITAVCSVLNLGFIRYRIPLEPYIIMTCIHGLGHAKKRLRPREG